MTSRSRLVRGQVTVEMALAASGLVVLAFMGAKVATWLNQSLVQRNDRFQATRTAAGQPGAGLVPVGTVQPIRLIGAGGSSAGGAGPQPPSTYNWVCPQGFAFLFHSAQDRSDAHNLMNFGSAADRNAITEADKVKPLLDGANALRDEAARLRAEAARLRVVAAGLRQAAQDLLDGIPALRAEARDLLALADTWDRQAAAYRLQAWLAGVGGNAALAAYYNSIADIYEAYATAARTTAAALNQSADNAAAVAATLRWYAGLDEATAAEDEATATNDENWAKVAEKAARQANAAAKEIGQAIRNTVVPELHQRLLHAEEDERQSIVQCGRR